MDQVKDILRQIARYRFWISVCIAALFATGAYVLGSGPVQKETADQTGKITSAYKDVQQYSNGGPTADFAPIVEQKTAVLTRDVDTAWRHLYDRQAPLLTWPESVSERFRKWGRKWPEDVDPAAVQLAIIDYIEAYPEYVDGVFKVFRPFNYETGEGVVASLPKDQLLKVVDFSPNQPPKLGEVWSAQERLWVQRTALEVIAAVNRNAKDWNSAYVKEIKALEVGSSYAQDQRSLAKGEALEEAEAIKAPNEPEEEAADAGGEMGMMMGPGMMGSGMGPGMGMGMGMGPGGKVSVAESVFYLKPENATQYKILPIMLTVLVDQDHVQDLLVEFENSPMSIEVRDFELLRPTAKVVKPEKGEMFTGAYGFGMMGPGMMGPGMMGPGMMGPGMMGGMRGMEGEMGMGPGMMGPGMMMPGMGMGMNRNTGVDKRGTDRKKAREDAEKARESKKSAVPFDAYYNIVEVTVYGQARFYNEPPAPEAAAESPGEATAETPQEPGAEAPKADMPKTEEPKAEEPKAEEPKAEEPKADMPKTEEPKAEEPKAEAPKAEEPKAEAAKPEEPKTEEPKAEAPAPAPSGNPTP
ncbi:hypothetical protein [Paludisphaera rhizosphaerae]|uniref:hypothetical protein n=1 Tax=Paludisphaera rhizosphaerae TaxID=2711216 RepID=UPI0013EAC5AB|nr:hypothetical protein [Paludisphaera rhizosphaerae]